MLDKLAFGSGIVPEMLQFAVIVCCSLFLRVAAFDGTEFAYNGFDPGYDKITCLQGASFVDNKIRLTEVGAIQGMGRALYSDAVQFRESASGPILSFSSQFIFSIDPGPEGLADGIAFVISPVLEGVENSSQGLLGILNNETNGQSSSHTFAVEFDGYKNPEFEDIDDNHVGIDYNSVVSWEAVSAAYKSAPLLENANDGYEIQLKGPLIQAWIDYDASKTQLNVSISRSFGEKPTFPLISNSSLDLSGLLEEHMYVGFSASTGPLPDVLYYVYAWSFSNSGTSAPVTVPYGSPGKDMKVSIILGVVFSAFVLLLIALGLSFVFLRRRHGKLRSESGVDSICRDHLPQKFSYRELSKATRGFHKEHLLGTGGFGSVYHGVLPSSGVAVAVKRISKESKQGVKEFVAEVSTIGRLRHRNLVPLLGWCEDRAFMLVYELMPNGSLDKFLFGKDKGCLPWALRFKVLTGVASALVYLHEEWEQKIVHRDVKASNVMLDSDFNARLGDFGLARRSGHDVAPETTNIAGTWGYVAPEYFFTRRATEKTDVFSYGALMLEVATGRKMTVLEEEEGTNYSLIESLWRRRGREELEKAADERLGMEFDREELKLVLELGLLCCHSEPTLRPTMRRVFQILSGDVIAPRLPTLSSAASSFSIALAEERLSSTSTASHSSSSAALSADSHGVIAGAVRSLPSLFIVAASPPSCRPQTWSLSP